jgi:protein-tyrosine phosphatase
MAAALASAKYGPSVRAISAGVEAGSGVAATRNARTVMAERGLDIAAHRSVDIQSIDLGSVDIVVAVEQAIAERLQMQHVKRLVVWDIADPYGGNLDVYRAAATDIERALSELNV